MEYLTFGVIVVYIILQQLQLKILKTKLQERHEQNQVVFNYIRSEFQKLKIELEDLHQLLRETESDIKSTSQSRFDKLTNQIIKSVDKVRSEIPPTNEEVLKRIDKVEKDSYTYRMNQ